jgi:ligand-binding sensor domain-containing protein
MNNSYETAISAIAVMPDGSVWVSFSVYEQPNDAREAYGDVFDDFFSGVWRYDGQSWSLVSTQDGLVDNEIRAMAVGLDGSLWLGSYNEGISRYDGQRWRTYKTNDGMLANIVTYMDISEDNDIWVGHQGGASHYDGQDWNKYYQIGDMELDSVSVIKVDPNGTVWLGTYDGVAQFDGSQWIIYYSEQYPWLRGVSAIFTLPDGTHLFGGDSAARFDGESWQSIPQLGAHDIEDIQALPDGTLWFATWNGVYSCKDEKCRQYTEGSGLASDLINALAVTPDGVVWAGTCNGVSLFDGKTWTWKTILKEAEHSVFCAAWDIAIDQDGIVWVASDRGLWRIEGENWMTYTTQDGLSSNHVTDLAIGPDGAVWIGSDAGLSRYMPPK